MRRARVRDPQIVWDPDVRAYRAVEAPTKPVPLTPAEKLAAGRATVAQLLAKEFGQTLRSTGATAGVRIPKHLRAYVTPARHEDVRPSAPRT